MDSTPSPLIKKMDDFVPEENRGMDLHIPIFELEQRTEKLE